MAVSGEERVVSSLVEEALSKYVRDYRMIAGMVELTERVGEHLVSLLLS